MIYCPYCNTEVKEEDSYCYKCGNKLNIECSKCQKKNRSDALFCSNCRNNLKITGKESSFLYWKNIFLIVLIAIILTGTFLSLITINNLTINKGLLAMIILFIGGLIFFLINKKFKNLVFISFIYSLIITMIFYTSGTETYSITKTISYNFSIWNIINYPPVFPDLILAIYMYYLKLPISIFISGILGGILGILLLLSLLKNNQIKKISSFWRPWKKSDIISIIAVTVSLIVACFSLGYSSMPGDLYIEDPTIFGINNNVSIPNSDYILLQVELKNDGGQDLVIKNLFLQLNSTRDTNKSSWFDMIGEYPELSTESFKKDLIFKRSLILRPHSTISKVLVFKRNLNSTNLENNKNYAINFGYTNFEINRIKINIGNITIHERTNEDTSHGNWSYWPIEQN